MSFPSTSSMEIVSGCGDTNNTSSMISTSARANFRFANCACSLVGRLRNSAAMCVAKAVYSSAVVVAMEAIAFAASSLNDCESERVDGVGDSDGVGIGRCELLTLRLIRFPDVDG